MSRLDSPIPSEKFPLITAHRTIIAVDVACFCSRGRNNTSQARVRHGMYQAIERAFDSVGISWTMCDQRDTGDGVLLLVSADIPKTVFVNYLPNALVTELTSHNKAHAVSEKIQMRLALHDGEISYDAHGVSGSSITHAFRLLDAGTPKLALAQSSAVLAIISSEWFYDEVIRHSELSQAKSYWPHSVMNTETTARAWVRLLSARGQLAG